MASACHEQCCSICELQHLTNKADEWCPECDEYLCSSCKTHHKLAKASRKHKIVEILDLKELPTFVSAIKLECDTHLENYEYFCPKHEIPICVICAKDHTSCGTFTILRRLEGMRTSPSMIKLEQNVKVIQQNLEIFLQNRRTNLLNIKDQHESCRQNVKEIRIKINQHLDKLEKTVNDEIDTAYTNQKFEVDQIIDDLSQRESKMNTIQNHIEKIKDHASEIQTFLSIQTFQKEAKEQENQIIAIGRDELKEIELSFHPVLSCTSGTILGSFGELKTHIKQVDISFVKQEESEAQNIIPETNKKDIFQISFTKRLDATVPTYLGDVVLGCCYSMDEGLHLLIDKGTKNRILVLQSDGALKCEIPLTHIPSAVANINKTIFVSSYTSMTLTSIDLDTKWIKKKIEIGHKCDALAVAGNTILLHLCDYEYRIYDLNLNVVGTIPVRVSYAPYLSYFADQIYFAQWKENTVYCYDLQGSMIWKFKCDDIHEPHGITADNYGNIFVCGYASNNIIVISPKGDRSRTILNVPMIMTYPVSIHHNKVTRQLLVSSRIHNFVLVFDVL